MSGSWTTLSVAECLAPMSIRGASKVQARDYQLSGRFPVIDQGQNQIAGWTDDAGAVISQPLPLIVFGDHTRAFKYIEVPFARGADGTQLLRPKPDIDPLFFFYACRAIDLPARGYNRHLTVLKEQEISLPNYCEEQKAIGLVLRRVELALTQHSVLIGALQTLKLAAMRDLFTRGLRGEPQKETDIGRLPESWSVDPIGLHHSVVSGGTPSRGSEAYWRGGTIPWGKTTEVNYCVIHQTEEHITQAGLHESAAKLLPAGTLLLAMYGKGVKRGKVAALGIEATCNQACAAIRPIRDSIETKYLYHFLASRYECIRQLAHGGQQQNLNLDIVRDLSVAFPLDKSEQREIVTILDTIDRKIDLHKQKLAVLEQLFKSLLHKLMTGETRVDALDLSALDSPQTLPAQITA